MAINSPISFGPPLNGSAGGGPSVYMAAGAALLGYSPSDPRMGVISDHFAVTPSPPGWTATVGAGGACADVAGFKGGISRISTSVTIGGNARDNNLMRIVGPAATDKWYFAWRFRVPSTVDANTLAGNGLRNLGATQDVVAGVFGNSSTVNYGIKYDGTLGAGTFASLGLAIDANFHIAEVWHPGDGKYHARIDSGTEITPVTPASPPTDNLTVSFIYDNGVAGVNHQMDRDWCVYLFTVA